MAKKTTTESGKEPTGKEIRIPADGTIKTFNVAFNEAHEEIDRANEALKDAGDLAKKKHLHMPSFKVAKGLYDKFGDGDGKNAEKLASWLANFDKARAFFKLDELANLQGRLLGEGEIGSKPPRAADEDGEPDMRPDHLRQPGASAASNPVRELAEKTGATVHPIDGVGRGNKPH